MKLVNWTSGDHAGFGIVTEGGPADGYAISGRDFNPAFTSTDDVLQAGALDMLLRWASRRQADVALAGVTLAPPVRSPGRVLCAGINYAPHRGETGFEVQEHPPVSPAGPLTTTARSATTSSTPPSGHQGRTSPAPADSDPGSSPATKPGRPAPCTCRRG